MTGRDFVNRTTLDTLIINLSNIMKNQKVTKSKDGNWIQKAINPKHKGFCTPMTKSTCTPKRKALAKTLKSMSKNKKN